MIPPNTAAFRSVSCQAFLLGALPLGGLSSIPSQRWSKGILIIICQKTINPTNYHQLSIFKIRMISQLQKFWSSFYWFLVWISATSSQQNIPTKQSHQASRTLSQHPRLRPSTMLVRTYLTWLWMFPKMVVPPKHPKMIIFSRKPMVVGYHHFRKHPYILSLFFYWRSPVSKAVLKENAHMYHDSPPSWWQTSHFGSRPASKLCGAATFSNPDDRPCRGRCPAARHHQHPSSIDLRNKQAKKKAEHTMNHWKDPKILS